MKAWMSSYFGKFATELLPLIDVRIEFLFNIRVASRARECDNYACFAILARNFELAA